MQTEYFLEPFVKSVYDLLFGKYPYGTLNRRHEDYVTGWILIIMFAILFAAIIGFAWWSIYGWLDSKYATLENLRGKIIDKKYKGAQSSSGTTTMVMPTTGGGMGIGIGSISSYSPEGFLLFVQADKVYEIDVDMQLFFKLNIGDAVNFEKQIGGYSKDQLKIKLV